MKYQKKPIIIEAERFTLDNAREITNWCGGVLTDFSPHLFITIETLEGDMKAYLGDWIIKGVKGEFYPCKPEIFAATYEKVGNSNK